MRKQQQIWLAEHETGDTLPTMANVKPTNGVVQFVDFLQSLGVSATGYAMDIGSGKGRNSIFLAKQGFTVTGMEYIKPAVEQSQKLAELNGVANQISFMNAEIDKDWPFKDICFSIIIDSFASIDIETKEGREKCRDEMYRTLQPGGYALVNVCSADDEWEAELIKAHPGPEPNSTVWPQNGKFQKDYSEAELKDFYSAFKTVELQIVRKPAHKLGRDGTATNLWLVIQKSA